MRYVEYENLVYRSASRIGAMDEKAVDGEWKPAGTPGLEAARYGRPMSEASARDFAGNHWPTVAGEPRRRFISTLPGVTRVSTCPLCGARVPSDKFAQHKLTAHGVAPTAHVVEPSKTPVKKKTGKGKKLTKSQMKKKKQQQQWQREAQQITFVSGGLPSLGKRL